MTAKEPEAATKWPSGEEYAAAMGPTPPPLVGGEFRSLRFARPVGVVGKSAVVYPVEGPAGPLALRLFTRDPGTALERYRTMSTELRSAVELLDIPYLVAEAVRTEAGTWPALVSRWVDGDNLDDALDCLVTEGDFETIETLRDKWISMISSLQEHEIGHGDLQHGNVLVSGGELFLVDLDAVWARCVSGLPPNERGHAAYQHPAYEVEADWGPNCDSFAAVVVLLAFELARWAPALWRERRAGSEDQMVIGPEMLGNLDHPLWAELQSSDVATIRTLGTLLTSLLGKDRPPSSRFSDFLGPFHAAERAGSATPPPIPDKGPADVPAYLRSARLRVESGELSPPAVDDLPIPKQPSNPDRKRRWRSRRP